MANYGYQDIQNPVLHGWGGSADGAFSQIFASQANAQQNARNRMDKIQADRVAQITDMMSKVNDPAMQQRLEAQINMEAATQLQNTAPSAGGYMNDRGQFIPGRNAVSTYTASPVFANQQSYNDAVLLNKAGQLSPDDPRYRVVNATPLTAWAAENGINLDELNADMLKQSQDPNYRGKYGKGHFEEYNRRRMLGAVFPFFEQQRINRAINQAIGGSNNWAAQGFQGATSPHGKFTSWSGNAIPRSSPYQRQSFSQVYPEDMMTTGMNNQPLQESAAEYIMPNELPDPRAFPAPVGISAETLKAWMGLDQMAKEQARLQAIKNKITP